MATRTRVAALLALVLLTTTGCADKPGASSDPPTITSRSAAPPATSGTPRAPATTPAPAPAESPARTSPAVPVPSPETPLRLSIPSLRVSRLAVVPYTGSPDDAPGTRIQNRGVAASPRGPEGGVGTGQVGNLIITAHRTTHGRPFGKLPSLPVGAHILLTSGGHVYDYQVTATRSVSFRSSASLARQSAPVPGHPGKRATRPMITLSTCATPEDHAAGNYWKDELGNPEHRIDKVGVLVAVHPA